MDQDEIPMNYTLNTVDLNLSASNIKDLLKAYYLPIDDNESNYSQKWKLHWSKNKISYTYLTPIST
jgi:hypothetical protein